MDEGELGMKGGREGTVRWADEKGKSGTGMDGWMDEQ